MKSITPVMYGWITARAIDALESRTENATIPITEKDQKNAEDRIVLIVIIIVSKGWKF